MSAVNEPRQMNLHELIHIHMYGGIREVITRMMQEENDPNVLDQTVDDPAAPPWPITEPLDGSVTNYVGSTGAGLPQIDYVYGQKITERDSAVRRMMVVLGAEDHSWRLAVQVTFPDGYRYDAHEAFMECDECSIISGVGDSSACIQFLSAYNDEVFGEQPDVITQLYW